VRAPSPSRADSRHRILLVNEDADIRQLSLEVLSGHGYAVDAAAHGATALRALGTGRYDLLITDYKLPRISGFELLNELHAVRRVLPAILAPPRWPGAAFFTRYPWLRPTAMLVMPYTVAEFLGTVEEVLRAAGGVPEQTTPPPNWQSRTSAVCLQL
jgi:DNA-binding NtrC family response regulator